MSRVLAGLLRRFAALPRSRRLLAGGVAGAILVAAAVTTALVAQPGSQPVQPTALRIDERANRGEARPTPTTSVPPTTAAPTTPAATTPPAKPATTPAKPATKPAAPKTTAAKPATGCSGWTGVKLTACNLLPSFGFSTSEMSALVPLWQHESGWNYKAYNSGSGAAGIPQALPGSKMATAGADWQTNPATQIKWGLGYIKSRYGSPSAAWSFWQAHGWY